MNQGTSNFSDQKHPEKKDNKKLIYGILIALLLISWAYFFFVRKDNKEKEIVYKDRIIKDSLSQASLQQEFDILTKEADSLTSSNKNLTGALAQKNAEIQQIKSNIASILQKKNATAAELEEAKKQIGLLQSKISDLMVEVQVLTANNKRLTLSNQQLTTDKKQLTTEKTELQGNLEKTKTEKENVESLASTFVASQISIEGIRAKGNKEKTTTNAKRADYFKINFVIEENRVASSGTKTIFAAIYNPDGSLADSEGNFTARDGDKVEYTSRVEINYQQGIRNPVSFNWKPKNKIVAGLYTVVIYHNGIKIGTGKLDMKKGGFLGL